MVKGYRQFRDLDDPIGSFENLFRGALQSLVPDLAASPWYIREREVVNLFVFGHLVPQFQQNGNLDLRQIGIEVPVQKTPESVKAKHGKYADILVWSHCKATIFRTCKPLVHIEWKNISCREENRADLLRQYAKDILFLQRDRQWASANYAVLTEWQDSQVKLHCTRILASRDPEDFFLTPLSCKMTCPDAEVERLQGHILGLYQDNSTCPDCATRPRTRAATTGA
jgi:hypothetical protein